MESNELRNIICEELDLLTLEELAQVAEYVKKMEKERTGE